MADEFTKAALYGISNFNKKVKEKIGMMKLIELLNEYENTDNWENRYQVEFRESKIISKKFGFIKWLVENDKIDLYKLPIRLEEYYQNTEAVGYITDDETILLMQLAIQDEPIEFLVSILK